ncbi:class I SAM-dependent methyltransferase [Tautonia plasticadhaerens]|uniref:Class I SAM-dependent methyltransferase n=1 Tax=Tautonia plasticadhaerens TaxID=2527974 RepID=A0A518GWT5_9BACT|nr:class I SAM-dependent methyltransferase [Tautonia plasticadhaerens]QDV33057.1 hypothetical protein ElP_08990 [Tautonia plasticadhaerens]
MYPFWPTLIKPLMMAADPRTIVEVGSEAGKNTSNLLEYCRERDAVLHAIDPAPKFDVGRWQQQHVGRLTVHRGLSLEILPRLSHYDCVFLDGDHNWYTVREELRIIDETAARTGRLLPLVFLHDMGWPYARRDLYYNPASIPEAHRQPYRRKGIAPGASALAERGGHNADLCNAEHEGGPRNGVLTAVEDYVKEAARPLRLVVIPGFSGLGILFDPDRFAQTPAFTKLIQNFSLSPLLARYIETLERSRIALMVRPAPQPPPPAPR